MEQFIELFDQFIQQQEDELDVMEACSLCGFIVKSDAYRCILAAQEYLDWFTAILAAYPENESILNCITLVICDLVNSNVLVDITPTAFLLVNCQSEYKDTLLRCVYRILIEPQLTVPPSTIGLIMEGVRMIQVTSSNCVTVLSVLYNVLSRFAGGL